MRFKTTTLGLLAFLLSFSNILQAQSGCPGCIVDLPPLPADTIYLGNAPDGTAGEYYDGDLSFRMPKTTTPVHEIDPNTPAGLPIGSITIQALLNVPPGLSWEANKSEFDPGNEPDGCVKFCGTPVVPGLYVVEVFVTATVFGLNQSTSFTFDFYIGPSTSTTDGFSLVNGNGCGEVTTIFQNNLPSNGNAGYSYLWDFGNGTTSTDENPSAVTYSQPGVYPIHYEAIIDTAGYELTTVRIVAAGCDDINLPPISNAPPEFYIKIKDPSGAQIYQSSQINNAPIPSAFNVNIPIGPGDYSLEVRDNDPIGSDHCGTVTFNRFSTDTLRSGSLGVLVDIFHPVFSVQSTDTVVVYEIPAPPVVSPNGVLSACEGESVLLNANYPHQLQWYRDSSAILGAIGQELLLESPGIYWVECISGEGCAAQSEAVTFGIIPIPNPPSFDDDGNWLSVIDTALLPDEYSLQWYLNSDPIEGATDTEYCNTMAGVNLFSLEVTDEQTGCSNVFSIGISFDPNSDCTVPTRDLILENSFRLFPNPVGGELNFVFENEKFQSVEIRILDALGRSLHAETVNVGSGIFQKTWSVGHLTQGLYLLEATTENGRSVRKFVKE